MSHLIVLMGKPGAGKSTLIKAALASHNHIDVMPFVKHYDLNGIVVEEKTILAYRDMYEYMEKELPTKKPIVLELGTNHAELNVRELERINKSHPVIIFLCEASIETCRARAAPRVQTTDLDALELRLNRDFPTSHLTLLEMANLKFERIDMEKPLEENIKIIKESLKS